MCSDIYSCVQNFLISIVTISKHKKQSDLTKPKSKKQPSMLSIRSNNNFEKLIPLLI